MGPRTVAGYHYCPRWVTAAGLSAALVALAAASGCHTSKPVVDLGSKPAARGTLTGTVSTRDRAVPIAGRDITVTNTETGEVHKTRTATDGGFTIEVPRGKYRVEVSLRGDEQLATGPGIIDLGRGDIDSHIAFVIMGARQPRPAGAGYRVNNGLGAPTA
jgi:hypothetical protein